MRNIQIILLTAVLVVFGLSIFLYKAAYLGYPLWPDERAKTFEIEARVTIDDVNGPLKATMVVPQSNGHFGIVDELFYSSGMGQTSSTDSRGNRIYTLAAREAEGRRSFYYRAKLYQFTADISQDPSQEQLAVMLDVPSLLEGYPQPQAEALEALVAKYIANSTDADNLVRLAISSLEDGRMTDEERIALDLSPGSSPSDLDKARFIALALRTDGVPAYVVGGLNLSGSHRLAKPVHWVNVWNGERWVNYNMNSGDPRVPDTYFEWWRDRPSMVTVDGGRLRRLSLAHSEEISPREEASAALAKIIQDPLAQMTLFGLPIEVQQVYKVLLLVPIGALTLIILRQIIGIKTFGVFMPVLIALSFRQTQLVNGIILFTTITMVGLAFRLYFERLKLLSVPRLSAVLIVIIILMVMYSFFLEQFALGSGLSIALFPVVILTMTVERMSVIWEEYGPKECFQQGAGTLLVAVICYIVMQLDEVQFLVFVYPELLLVLLAVAIWFGRYTGYRLTELVRFKSLAEKGAP
ncbi:hypothetical protein E1162_06465 [Rhodobacteraceae bacterium RKSG542]|uniref:UUP1 family membrane protein n=1 Tax=Pseudovibrio flavus TaxID=2529854 RepID=UPI0012BC47D6|nr:UUP1 family membrane protein [Pseudovibrio flavus]MTI16877.1 hypothetical protein [Pseudovibrio flavus]